MDSSMTILSAQYIAIDNVNDTVKATIDGQELSVPLDPANRHYAEILRQVEAGTLTIADAD
jgi:hypothetical protein|tara:strand:- start:631 stop:813 length:183 start_codon:yes stop_codon:yes gene_type:complete